MVAKTSRGTAGGARGRRGGGRTVPGGRPAHLVRLPPRRPAPAGDRTGPFLRSAAAHAWRLIVVGIVVYGLFVVLGRFQTIAVALFLALVITSVLRPATDLLARLVPRPLAVALALVGSIVVLLGLLALVGDAVANESSTLADEFRNGVHRIEVWLQRPPFRLSRQKLSDLQDQIVHYFSAHRADPQQRRQRPRPRRGVRHGGALALFASVFFLHSGERLWTWSRDEVVPGRARPGWDRAGRAAWRAFAGYTRGIIIVAATNAVIVGIALLVLEVPLALPLALLEFFAAFVPLIGSPVALGVATVVALAGRGPAIALVVLALIVIVGQLEGHVLHPLVMGWAVRLHPLVVAVSVLAGGTVAGVIGAVVAVPFVSVAWAVFRALRPAPT